MGSRDTGIDNVVDPPSHRRNVADERGSAISAKSVRKVAGKEQLADILVL